MKIYINEKIQEDNFIDYIKNKFKFKNLEYLGSGLEGAVFKINPYKVIKFTRTLPVDYRPFLNRRFKHLMNVYAIGEIDVPSKFINSYPDVDDPDVDEYDYIILNKSRDVLNVYKNKIYYIISQMLYKPNNIDIIKQVVTVIRDFFILNKINIWDYDILYNYFFEDGDFVVDVYNLSGLNKRIYNDIIKAKKTFKYEHYRILLQIIKGFEELTDNDIDAFDIHSGNIMMTKDGTLKLIDYDMNFNKQKNLANINDKKGVLSSTIRI